MKILRVWLLFVLAVLIPVRGAIATAMPCADEGTHQHTTMHAHEHAHAMNQAPEPMHCAAVSMHHHDQGGPDKCNICASCCSTTPMLSTFAPTVAQLDEAAAIFAAIEASAPTFVSEGQERPPRSI